MSSFRSSLRKNKKMCACGASGCVIYPGLDCGESKCLTKPCKKPIATKLFMEDDSYENEIQNFDKDNKLLYKLDEGENYFLSTYEPCGKIADSEIKDICKNIPKQKVKNEKLSFSGINIPQNYEAKEIDENDWMRRGSSFKSSIKKDSIQTNSLYRAINFSYLGIPMQNILPNLNGIEEIKQFLISVKNIFEGIKILNEAEIYHSDIKPQNIVLDDRDNQFKIIDFGQAIFKAPKLRESSEWQMGDNITGYTAGFVSPEYFFYLQNLYPDVTFFGDAENFDHQDDKIIRYLKSYMKNGNTLKENKQISIINDSYYKELEEKQTYIKNDVWSLGCVLKYIRSELLVKLENTTNEDLNIFLVNVISKISNVINKLLILNVEKRPTPSKALELYTDFLNGSLNRFTSTTRKGGRKPKRRMRRTRKKGINKRRTFNKKLN